MNMIPPPLPPYSYRLKKKKTINISLHCFFFSHASNCQFANFLFFKSNKYINYFHVSLSSPPLHHALFFFSFVYFHYSFTGVPTNHIIKK